MVKWEETGKGCRIRAALAGSIAAPGSPGQQFESIAIVAQLEREVSSPSSDAKGCRGLCFAEGIIS